MLNIQLIANFILFMIGFFGIMINRRNVLLLLICIEILLLSVNLNFLLCSSYLDDIFGQAFSILILTIAAAESALGLAILILFYRMRGNISINEQMLIKN